MARNLRSKRRSSVGVAAAVAPVISDRDDEDHVPVIDDENDGGDGGSMDAEESSPVAVSALSKSEQTWNSAQSSLSDHLLPLISRPEDLLTTLLTTTESAADGVTTNNGDVSSRQQLITTSQQLFQYIERLASMEEGLKEMQKQNKLKQFEDEQDDEEEKEVDEEDEGEPCSLSGLPALYTGEPASAEAGMEVDAETIWGQVDLQNSALMSRLKKMIKKLAKRADSEEEKEDVIRILDTGAMADSDDEEGGDSEGSEDNEGDDMSEGSAASDGEDEKAGEDNDSNEDSDARRIRERMERSMAAMMSDDDDEEEEDVADKDKQARLKELASKAASLEEDMIDPTREDMRDGFFDLHEMEAFADEEEEMLPDDAYGEELPEVGDAKKKEKGLPHMRDRVGNDDSESDEDGESEDDESDDDEEDALAKKFEPTTIRRKKYRADDEVEALYQLYDDKENDNDGFDDSDDEQDEEVDASTMSAADFFGNPDKKLINSYKAKQKAGSKKKAGAKKEAKASFGNGDNDDDSWDNHNFEEDGMDWKDKGEKEDGEDTAEEEEGGGEEGEEDATDEDEEKEQSDIEADANKKLSVHQIHSQKLSAQTLQLEQDLMAEKPWRMMGEAKGKDRASDSLLDSTPEFEVAFKPPPILTEEHTENMEEMIKRRIIDEDYDNVVPRELPDIGAYKRGGEAPEVSQEKSKLGLGELYEREYLKKTTGHDRTATEKQTEEDAAKEEMKDLFANLCSQLDALSNYQFAPRPVADEADVKNRSEDKPAIAMEEVLPLHVSNSRGMAPEEVYGGGKKKEGVLKGESELDQAERKRLRNGKKAARRKARKHKHADEKLISKLQPGLGLNNPYEKRKLREELQMARASGKYDVASENKALYNDEAAESKEYQTSTKFFAKMQENVETLVRDGDEDGGQAKKKRKGLEAGQGSSVYRL